MPMAPTYIVAARRTALGRVGGLHRHRRIEDLAAPVVRAALADARIAPQRVDELLIGNTTQGGNPARLIALASGLPETTAAATLDRQCASGLDAILAACRIVAAGESDVVVAGGVESLSTAPWRIARPLNLYQTPHFLGLEPAAGEDGDQAETLEAAEALSRSIGINRARQDAWTLHSHLKAEAARDARRMVGEIVPLRANAEEARDESATGPSLEDLERLHPMLPPKGTLTRGNTSTLHDGAAIVVVVSERIYEELGRPRALRVVASASQGVAPDREASAPIDAVRKLYRRLDGISAKDIAVAELSESSAAQAIAFAHELGLDDDRVNPDGGAVVRGHPLGAASAVLVVRLFTRMVRGDASGAPKLGLAALGARGGLGLAVLFEAI